MELGIGSVAKWYSKSNLFNSQHQKKKFHSSTVFKSELLEKFKWADCWVSFSRIRKMSATTDVHMNMDESHKKISKRAGRMAQEVRVPT
jgi:hypothetical protein